MIGCFETLSMLLPGSDARVRTRMFTMVRTQPIGCRNELSHRRIGLHLSVISCSLPPSFMLARIDLK